MSSSRNIQYERRWCSYNTERFRIKSPRGTIRRLQNYYFNSCFLFLFFLFYIYYVLRTNSPTEMMTARSALLQLVVIIIIILYALHNCMCMTSAAFLKHPTHKTNGSIFENSLRKIFVCIYSSILSRLSV